MNNPIENLNKTFDSRVRLGIMSTLMVNDKMNFKLKAVAWWAACFYVDFFSYGHFKKGVNVSAILANFFAFLLYKCCFI